MALRTAPAALPALVAVLACLLGAAAEPRPPVASGAALVGLGLALGGGAGTAVLAGAAGALAVAPAPVRTPLNDTALVAEVEATICGRWRRRTELATATTRLCPVWLKQGPELLTDPPELWLSIPDATTLPPLGATIRARGSLSRFPGLANQPAVAPGPWRLRVKASRMLTVIAPPGPMAFASSALRSRIERALDRAGSGSGGGTALVRGLVLGDDDGLPDEVRRALRRCGLAHLLAVSGFNLTLVVAFAALAAGARAHARAIALPAAAVALYLATVGPELSLLRAALMAGATLALVACGRAPAPLQALSLAALGVAVVDPGAIEAPGLQLSCGATAGLLLFARRWSGAFSPLPRLLSFALAASVAAQIGALPASVAAFSEVSFLSPCINLLALPWAVAATALSLAWSLLALAHAPAARALTFVLDGLAAPLFALDRLPASPWISTSLEGGALAGAAAAAVVAIAMESLVAGRHGLVALGALLLSLAPTQPGAGEARLIFVDVAQGDAAVVSHGGRTLLVDGGGLLGRDIGTDGLRPLLARLGVVRIDAALVSHEHRDHCAGLSELSRQLPIDEILVARGALGSLCVADLTRRARSGTRELAAGSIWRMGGIVVEAVSPQLDEVSDAGNAGSLAVRLRVEGRAVLFAGDLGGEEELRLAREFSRDLGSDILKVSHHGSASSSTAPFLEAVGARWAVVSAGARNPFGHPAASALARLVASGATVVRTDRDGMVVLRWRTGEPIRLELPASPRIDPPGG